LYQPLTSLSPPSARRIHAAYDGGTPARHQTHKPSLGGSKTGVSQNVQANGSSGVCALIKEEIPGSMPAAVTAGPLRLR